MKSSKNSTKSATNKPEPSHTMSVDLDCIPELSERLSGAPEQRLSLPQDPKEPYDDVAPGPGPLEDCLEFDLTDDVAIIDDDVTKTDGTISKPVNSDANSQLNFSRDEDLELQAMFYLPKWRSASPPSAELHSGREESLRAVLANVEALLSRSPPSQFDDLEAEVDASSPQVPLQPFQVSFTLDIDDNDDEVSGSDPENHPAMPDLDKSGGQGQENREMQSQTPVQQSASRSELPSRALTWDSIFDDHDDDVENNYGKQTDHIDDDIKMSDRANEEDTSCRDDARDQDAQERGDGVRDDPQMDNSMDLFEDDEAFLQMTIPDIPTPRVNPRTPNAPHAAENPRGEDETTPPTAAAPKAPSSSDAAASDQHLQQGSFDESRDLFSVNFDLCYSLDDSDEDGEVDPGPPKQADSSTPHSCFHQHPLQPSAPRLSTPHVLSEHRRRETSLFTTSLPKGDAFPSPIASARVRRTILPDPSSPHTSAELSGLKRRRTDRGAAPVSPHPGRSSHREIRFPNVKRLFCPAPDARVSSLSQRSAAATARMTSWCIDEDS